MSNLTVPSNKDRKRSLVRSESLLNLKTLICQNEKINQCKFSSIKQNDHFDEVEKKKQKQSQAFPNRNILVEDLTEPDLKNLSDRRIVTTKEPSLSKRIVVPRTSVCEKSSDTQQTGHTRVVTSSNSNDEQYPSHTCIQPLLSANNTDEEYVTRMHHIVEPWNNHGNELKQKESVNSLFCNSPKTNDDQTNTYSEVELFTHRTVISESTLIHSPVYHKYDFARTPKQELQPLMSLKLLDCCKSNQQELQSILAENNSDYWNNFHTSVLLRKTMLNVSKRLTKDQSLPIVDTHCHFDLIFDRLYIKHNDLKQYFDDYKGFYPSGLSFELAIQVFWRPRHLTEENWINWYSKYLNDERVYGSCGIHPHWSSEWKQTSIEDIERCFQHPKVIAIGEIGLDFGPKNTCNADQQCRAFEEQLKLAVKWIKPIVIHSRDAYKQTFDIMKQHLEPDHKIHLHCFVGTIDDVHLFTSYFTRIKFGFTPMITRTNSLHTVIQQLDLEQILSETDSPYFIPEELSSLSRCAHPGMVYSVIETVAQIRQLPIIDVACQLRKNACHIYGV